MIYGASSPDPESGVKRLLCSAVLALFLCPSLAAAQGGEAFVFDGEPQLFALGGLSTGGTFGSAGGGGYVGGELSFVWLSDAVWAGGYADAVYDFAQDGTVLTLGPEFGLAILGFDGGLGLRFGREDETEVGYQARMLLDLGAVFALYGRYGFWPDSSDGKHVGQVGVLLKFPLWTTADVPATAR